MIFTIFGYPKTGKTLLFNLLTDKKEEISKFSAVTNKFHKAVVDVPDNRLKKLSDYFKTPPVFAKIEYLDTGKISFGEANDTTFIDLLRRADGLVHIVRAFEDPEIVHPKGSIDALRDINRIEEELRTVDFLSIEKRLEKLEIDIKKMKSKELEEEFKILKKLKNFLEKEKPLRELELNAKESTIIRGFKFLSLKPLINVINSDETFYKKYLKLEEVRKNNTATIISCEKIESELLELEEDDRLLFQEEYGLKDYKYTRNNFIKTSYELLNLISFFTVGADEVKAWTINKNSSAYIAAGKIHTDIQHGFIKAEVIKWKDFLDSGGFTQAKEKGLLKLEGKDYIVNDGEIVHFRFNK